MRRRLECPRCKHRQGFITVGNNKHIHGIDGSFAAAGYTAIHLYTLSKGYSTVPCDSRSWKHYSSRKTGHLLAFFLRRTWPPVDLCKYASVVVLLGRTHICLDAFSTHSACTSSAGSKLLSASPTPSQASIATSPAKVKHDCIRLFFARRVSSYRAASTEPSYSKWYTSSISPRLAIPTKHRVLLIITTVS